MGDLDVLFREIDMLLSGSGGDLAEIEKTLTDGYAQALSLEAERWRLERRIGEVASSIENGDATTKTREISSLAKRLELSDLRLARLRGVLVTLRAHADVVRAAS